MRFVASSTPCAARSKSTTPPGHLSSLVASLASAAKAGAEQPGDPLANAIRQNVVKTVTAPKSASPILDAAIARQKLKVVGGIYRRPS